MKPDEAAGEEVKGRKGEIRGAIGQGRLISLLGEKANVCGVERREPRKNSRHLLPMTTRAAP